MAEEETDSEDDGGLPQRGHRSQPRGVAGNRNGSIQRESGPSSQREIQPFSAHQITDRRSGCPINHSHKICEEIDLSFKNNCELFLTSYGTYCRNQHWESPTFLLLHPFLFQPLSVLYNSNPQFTIL